MPVLLEELNQKFRIFKIALCSAIVDGEMPIVINIDLNISQRGEEYVEGMLRAYPALRSYMGTAKLSSEKRLWARYVAYLRERDYFPEWVD